MLVPWIITSLFESGFLEDKNFCAQLCGPISQTSTSASFKEAVCEILSVIPRSSNTDTLGGEATDSVCQYLMN